MALTSPLRACLTLMPVGALAQDGGLAVNDLTANMPDQDRMALAKEFFLS